MDSQSLGALRESTRQLYALCFFETCVPPTLAQLKIDVLDLFNALRELDSILPTSSISASPCADITSGLSDLLTGLGRTLSPWIEDTAKSISASQSDDVPEEKWRSLFRNQLEDDRMAMSLFTVLLRAASQAVRCVRPNGYLASTERILSNCFVDRLYQVKSQTDLSSGFQSRMSKEFNELDATVNEFYQGYPRSSNNPVPRSKDNIGNQDRPPDVTTREKLGHTIQTRLEVEYSESVGQWRHPDGIREVLKMAAYWVHCVRSHSQEVFRLIMRVENR